ncbi:MAG: BamA/TamA family outer membrane protein [Deltaproteobacteria bacterium]|nr:BamA/TamA family outer membrane protein [Deltaproteobacteria bacterium]
MRFPISLVIAAALVPSLAAADPIGEIIVDKNTKTTDDTVMFISKIEVGDDWTGEMADAIKVRLVSSGLFKEVEVWVDPVPTKNGGIRVHLEVVDKHSWVIAPAFYNQPTNTGGGIGFGENNLFGANQKLLLYGQIATGDSFFIGAWQLPSIAGTRFFAQFDTYLVSQRNFEYESATKWLASPRPLRESRMLYLNNGARLGVDIYRGIRLSSRLRGAKVSFSDVKLAEGATKQQLGLDESDSIPKPGKEGWDVSTEVNLTIDRRANWYGVQSGYRYSVSYEVALPQLGSDFDYKLVNVNMFRAWQVLERHNFIWKLGGAYGSHLPFQQEFLMGGTSMRGWLNNQFRGDFKVQTNLEYSFPMFTAWGLSVRGLGFLDSGYTTYFKDNPAVNPDRNYLPLAGTAGLAPFKNSVGVGTRFYLRQIVLPLLGLDVGFGLESQDVQVYLAIGLTD